MEDNIQTIIIVIISAFILFIFPVYMAYEKKDDISYALAMRYTQDLVDEIRSKGYITKTMYEDYRVKLKLTGNSYDIQMTHEYNRYDPITNYYEIIDGKYTLVKTTTRDEKEQYEQELKEQGLQLGKITENSSKAAVQAYIDGIYESQNIHKVEDTYKLSTETYATDYILNVLNSERKLKLNSNSEVVTCEDDVEALDGCQYAYVMNVDDNFNITIKNTNITLATVMYNMVTANTLDTNTRIYVNYGGDIISSKWYGDVDYAKMKHDNLSLVKSNEQIVFTDARHYYMSTDGAHYPTATIAINDNQNERYVIEFEAKPEETTELREKGNMLLTDISGYNFALGNSSTNNNKDRLSVSVGINGVSLIASSTTTTSYRKIFFLPYYNSTIVNLNGQETTQQVQRKITDYYRLRVFYENNKLKLTAMGKDNVDDASLNLDISAQEVALWKALNTTINNPAVRTYNSGPFATGEIGTQISYKVQANTNTVYVTASKVEAKKQTLLSYATDITDYTKIRIEFNKQDNGLYVAVLYINDVRVAESIEMETVPKANVVGKTIIGSDEEFFAGYIRNVKIYEMGD